MKSIKEFAGVLGIRAENLKIIMDELGIIKSPHLPFTKEQVDILTDYVKREKENIKKVPRYIVGFLEIRKDGHSAFLNDIPIYDNPHFDNSSRSEMSQAAETWDTGWLSSKSDVEKEAIQAFVMGISIERNPYKKTQPFNAWHSAFVEISEQS